MNQDGGYSTDPTLGRGYRYVVQHAVPMIIQAQLMMSVQEAGISIEDIPALSLIWPFGLSVCLPVDLVLQP